MFLQIVLYLSLAGRTFSLIFGESFNLERRRWVGWWKDCRRQGWQMPFWLLAPFFPAGSLGKLFTPDLLICKLRRIQHLSHRVEMRTNKQ